MFENINWMVSNIFAADDDFVIRENESPGISKQAAALPQRMKIRVPAHCV